MKTKTVRVDELEAERAELEETAAANWNHCQEVDSYLIELLGEDFPTDAENSAENTKAAIRKLIEDGTAMLANESAAPLTVRILPENEWREAADD